MSIQHSVITDPNIHEPKGVAAAAVNTSYIANGSGSGSWQKVVIGLASALANQVFVADGSGSGSWQTFINAGQNLGTNAVFLDKSGTTLRFRGITITNATSGSGNGLADATLSVSVVGNDIQITLTRVYTNFSEAGGG